MFSSRTSYQQLVARGLTILLMMVIGGVSPGALVPNAFGDDPEPDPEAVRRGWDVLVNKALLPSDFSQKVFDHLWQSWPEPLRSQAEKASLAKRRRMAMTRYGLTPRPLLDLPDDVGVRGVQHDEQADPGKPLQYVVDENGDWTMNCFSCHGGSVYGKPTPGAPNNRYALQTLTEEVRSTKFRLGIGLGRMELGSLVIPLGTTNGTTNAVVFGMGLMNYRDEDLNLIQRPPQSFTHHDMDAPPWWHFYKRPNIYIDGFAEKGHRGLMQFTLVPENGPEFYREHENDFRDVFAFLSSLRPPQYGGQIDETLAEKGRDLFEQTCSQCHGTYGDQPTYPNRRVPLDDIGTDPVRLTALSEDGRAKYARSWFSVDPKGNRQTTVTDPDGYVAPPLDGVWASPPYFHNGSVPTLWHVLHPEKRPEIWLRTSDIMDETKVGLTVEVVDKVPFEEPDVLIRRNHFDTRRFGKKASGHDYPNELSEQEKRAVLEYLKTL